MGKFHKILEPGLNILLPVVDKVKYVQILKELAIDVPQQSAVTSGENNYQLLNINSIHTIYVLIMQLHFSYSFFF